MSENGTYTGACFCGAVEIKAEGGPFLMGYCHCDSCRHWSAAPVSAFSLWRPGALTVTKGEDNVLTYNKTPDSFRKSCKACGGHVYSEHPGKGFIDIYPAVLRGLEFKPVMHVSYGESVLRVKDGLPKFKTFPNKDGEGEMMDE
ncbi:MAG TPA: GFA family protein [Thermodesulfobacteriota bacterium]|nr:GFA family protein [Thermodesulfobacteriota bacterium]